MYKVLNTGNQVHSTVSSVGIWDSFSHCLLLCTLLTRTFPLQSLPSSTSLEYHPAKCSLHGHIGSEKGEGGKERSIYLYWGTESWSGCVSGITHHLKHHSLAVKSQAGELVASLWPYKQGEEEADVSESRFGTILSWWSSLILKRLVCTSCIFTVRHFKMHVCKQLARSNIPWWGIFSGWRQKSLLIWLT